MQSTNRRKHFFTRLQIKLQRQNDAVGVWWLRWWRHNGGAGDENLLVLGRQEWLQAVLASLPDIAQHHPKSEGSSIHQARGAYKRPFGEDEAWQRRGIRPPLRIQPSNWDANRCFYIEVLNGRSIRYQIQREQTEPERASLNSQIWGCDSRDYPSRAR